MFERLQVIAGALIATLGLSMSYKWFLSPTPSNVPFIGLIVLVLGLAAVGSGLRSASRKSRRKGTGGGISPTTAVAGGIGAAIAIAGIKALIDEMNKKSGENKSEAIVKLKQLEDEYNKVKYQLPEDQRRLFENAIQDYKRRLGVDQ
ncbi:hypothetical protein GCM10007981_04370 [Thermocladium modestius]|uniref:Uncharacterized protein n=1 Tax=Thermocladium modestius TaxID=62609 RepID=A0A830GUC6_9CREN|nr:hypothetical protein [Thermocladium modestius]GGP19686.1 hypothetical protein GCM10007981_04370 [Thermocladium modestius]